MVTKFSRRNIWLFYFVTVIVLIVLLCLSILTVNSIWIDEKLEEPILDRSDYDKCPRDFLIPKCNVQIWKYLSVLAFPNNCDQHNCSKCIPPNSRDENLNKLHQLWYVETYTNKTNQRHEIILDLLQHNGLQSGHENDPVILMVFNYGFSYLFLNWACSLDYNKLSYLRQNSLIIVSDEKSKMLANKYGFNAVFDLNRIVADISSLGVTEEASQAFPQDTFKPLVTFQMIILSDLIELGYDVMMMDIDIIFQHDPLKYLKNNLYKWVDIWTMLAPRYDSLGFANTGLIVMKSNCKTKTYMHTMMQYITAIYRATDQQAFNFWLFWKPFRQIVFKLLDRDMFIGGNDITLGITKANNIAKYNEFILFHAYSTRDHFDKIYKFEQIDHWYFTKAKCAHMFNETMIPDLSDRVDDKTHAASSAYLIKHNLITDKFQIYNGTEPLYD